MNKKLYELEQRLKETSQKISNSFDLEEVALLINKYKGHYSIYDGWVQFNWKLHDMGEAFPPISLADRQNTMIYLDFWFWETSMEYAKKFVEWIEHFECVKDTDVDGRNGGYLIIKLNTSYDDIAELHNDYWHVQELIDDYDRPSRDYDIDYIESMLVNFEIAIDDDELIRIVNSIYNLLNNIDNKFEKVKQEFYSNFRKDVMEQIKLERLG